MKKKCIPVNTIIAWTAAGYAAYLVALYVWRKPVCEYAERLCAYAQQDQR